VPGYVWAEVSLKDLATGFLEQPDDDNNHSSMLSEQINVDRLSHTEMGDRTSHAKFRFNQFGLSGGSLGGTTNEILPIMELQALTSVISSRPLV
jgi:hypothetical protein